MMPALYKEDRCAILEKPLARSNFFNYLTIISPEIQIHDCYTLDAVNRLPGTSAGGISRLKPRPLRYRETGRINYRNLKHFEQIFAFLTRTYESKWLTLVTGVKPHESYWFGPSGCRRSGCSDPRRSTESRCRF